LNNKQVNQVLVEWLSNVRIWKQDGAGKCVLYTWWKSWSNI